MWEYPSAVSLLINEVGERVIINNWIVQGYMNAEGEAIINDIEPSFDIDEYKIIWRFLKQNRAYVRLYRS